MNSFHEDPQWIEDCLRWRGKKLNGNLAHYCWDWDGLPMDETCYEFTTCYCYDDLKGESYREHIQSIKKELKDEFERLHSSV